MGDAVSIAMSALPPTNITSEVPFNPLALLQEVPSLNNTFGAFLLGTFIGLMLYGLTLHQTYRYYRLFPGDLKLIQAFVITTLVLETIHTVLCMHIWWVVIERMRSTVALTGWLRSYYYLVLNYAKPLALLDGVWSIRILPISTALVILVSECFFTRRVYLSAWFPTANHAERGLISMAVGSKYTKAIVAITPVLMVVFTGFAAELLGGVAASAEAFIRPTFAGFDGVAWMTSAGFGAAVAIDALLAVTLVITLHKSRTGFKRTDSLIDLLIIYTINTGLVTGVFGILSFIFALVWPESLIWSACNLVATKTYATSLLAVLNSRKRLTDKVSEDCFDSGTIDLSVLKTTSSTAQHRTAAERWNVHQLQNRDVVDIALQPTKMRRGDEESLQTENMEPK
ncbi:hypothetical protein NUW54_g4688 [Trametes sanguinea]|uniref:Uncharacterized protein n=1 Tax=Trametes sanguinea TaxID=158606 RepID=A0ACC1PYH2_9APHY|nr:hypothetical protein NUW54_g4688 [Trametes sanguinea]